MVETTKTVTPFLTSTPPTIVPFGGTGTPEATETSMPTSTLIVIPPVTPTHTATSTPFPSPTHTTTATASPSPTQTATATASPPPCLPCTATAQVSPTTTIVPNDTEVPPTSPPSLPPTVGPGGNPGSYSTLGFLFGLIAVTAFFLYFSGAIITRHDPN